MYDDVHDFGFKHNPDNNIQGSVSKWWGNFPKPK